MPDVSIPTKGTEDPCVYCDHVRNQHKFGEGHCIQETCDCLVFVEATGENLKIKASRQYGRGETKNKRAEILETAESLINGDRADTYGPPEVSFGRIADLLNAMGFRKIEGPTDGRHKVLPLTAVDAALALTQLKISRIIGSPDHEDSWVDGAGYLALGGEMATRKKES